MSRGSLYRRILVALFLSVTLAVFFLLRAPLIPGWWSDFNSDYAIVGIMAQHTLGGHFPIYYYGQNYMGGLEWLTAALGAMAAGSDTVTVEILRWNSLAWWALAAVAWVAFGYRVSLAFALGMAALFAFGNQILLGSSVAQELSPQYVFFGALLTWLLWARKSLTGLFGALFGTVLGLAWWTNQSVIFFLLPGLYVFHAEPRAWLRSSLGRSLRRPLPPLRWLYVIAGALTLMGLGIALAGGLRLEWGSIKLKIPNGISLVKTAIAVVGFAQFCWFFVGSREFRENIKDLLRKSWPFGAGFLLGFSPVWVGRLFGFYEKAYGVSLSILPLRQWPGQTLAFGNAMDAIFLSGAFAQGTGTPATGLGWIVVIALGLVGWRFRQRPLVRFALGALALNCLYVFFSGRSEGAPTRYLYGALIGGWIIVLDSVAGASSSRRRAGALVAIVIFAAWSGWYGGRAVKELQRSTEWRQENFREVMSMIRARGHEVCWGDYWTSYLLTYLSGERLILSPHPTAPDGQVRIRAYADKVSNRDPHCFISRDGSPTGRLKFSETNPWH